MSVPTEYFDEIQDAAAGPPRGFGSVRVTRADRRLALEDLDLLRIGGLAHATSLPIKKAVRTAEGIDVGDAVTVDVELELLGLVSVRGDASGG